MYVDEEGVTRNLVRVPNPEVLKAGMKHVEEHIEHWNQLDWFSPGTRLPDENGGCGTSACLAGHILLAAGHDWKELSNIFSISAEALDTLGFERGSDDWNAFDYEVFCYTRDDDIEDWEIDNTLAYTPERLATFKQRVTEVTGVEFE